MYQAVMFYASGFAPMKSQVFIGETPEEAFTEASKLLYPFKVRAIFGNPTYCPKTGVVFYNGVPCGCVWELKP